jgi:hypothetical protein
VLAATWAGLKTLGSRRVRWYAPFVVGAAIQGFNAVSRMLEGEWAFGFTSALFAALLALWPVAARYEFRQAWSDGYVEGVFFVHHAIRGTVAPPVARQAATGYLAPEPWDRPPPPPPEAPTKGAMP